ncbi:MAG: aminoacyl--tRNA ligase-related protein, partial [Bacillota bacterium]|nr:aminoacyl--tRNA ligase-related protein [Bacillota bacterium]
LFRNEASGEMHGLIRVRQFTISEGHIVCAPDQLEVEFRSSLDLASFMLESIGLDEDVSYRYSTWDPKNREKYIGSEDQWAAVQDTMQGILDHMGLSYELGFGEAAFYGPKLDIQIKNVFGKEDTLITIQIDFQLAERFGMVFTDRDGNRQHPIIIHRTSIGCYERTLALLIEKYAGALPLWIAPEQARILPISERHLIEAQALADRMRKAGLRVTVDDRDEKIGKKIREGQMDKLQYMLIMGDQEIEQGTISVRARLDGELGSMTVDDMISKLKHEVTTRRNR